ncbi:Na+/H+ antiporter NhaA [Aliarcobacter butzleri]|uniref:Na(+)/H(+) antiporter NhaA n=2 Tax=Aliarcobacter butzleri TaxID=28197 RepID=A0AAW7PTY5_9BACT|nr:Na+/H+ antiporter NhaA [Aliarcobacter butzleri]KLE02483.1 sodium:proton antiporter [Aliarcobacter butzleri L348]KLE04929.1 sodium:proton antiporter [Aliarcobacter butzleri L353]MCG3667822.1 Na+/H+ antiporter NhaA [Aliarcobacter butzleri]MCG3713585.1 Na+/H+ antiporter NhaA [Aliarcobacter butzleri]MCT7564108.1 Na+/H+ antiporter NhaA [Aliarcobacter butzleri]
MKNSLFLIKDFISKETLSGLILFVVTVLAVTIANSSFGSYYFELFSTQLGITFGQLNASMSLLHWINDVLMAIFFLVVGLEIKREMLIGELSSVKKASFPIIAAIGGMIVPAILYISLNPDHITGFGVPMATDIAFALGILMLLGNKVNPAIKLFLVTLAVVDDLGAIVVVAIFYTNELHFEYFLYAFAVYSIIWFLNYKNVQKLTPYIILGVFLWIFIHKTGIHSTIAGVLLAFAIPLNKKADLEESVEHLSVDNPLVKLEHALHNFSAFIIMPLFAFANAGVIIDFSNVIEHQLIVLGVAIGLIIGKPIGIFSFTYLATKLKISVKPENVTWNDIFAVGFLGGIGFTMSIFISHLAFSDQTIVGAVKLGIFASSVIAAIIGSVLLILKAKKVQS